MEEGKLVGHIVSVHGVKIEIDILEAINTIPFPRHKKVLQSFFVTIIFLRRFIPKFAEEI